MSPGAGPPYARRTWYVCDRCLSAVGWREVAIFADGEHVICRECELRANTRHVPLSSFEAEDICSHCGRTLADAEVHR